MRVKLPNKNDESESSDSDPDIEYNIGAKERSRIKHEAEMRRTKNWKV
jgi:hypothetical protein